METKYFDNGFVGKKVDNANEAIMLHNAGMDIRAKNGCDFLWCDDDNEEPSVSEVASRIIECINDHGFVYAGFELEGQKVVRDASTNLSCDVQKGQTVYFLYGGVIEKGEVASISMSSDNFLEDIIRHRLRLIRECAVHINDITVAMNFLGHIDDISMLVQHNFVTVKNRDGQFRYISLNKVFASKDDLISNLIVNAK